MIEYKRPRVVSEIGCNHKGSLEIAKELVDLSKFCNADVAKFQKRNPKELLTREQYNAPHPVPENSYGSTYGEHREFLELSVDQHRELKQHCESIGIEYATSVWDVTSAREVISLAPNLIKVPSACNTNRELMEVLRDEYDGEVHISTGMTTKDEIIECIRNFNKGKDSLAARNRVVLYSCTSGYPVPFKDICLLEICNILKQYKDVVKDIGFSGHHLGIAVDVAAYTLGATWIERHFTKDRTWKGTDHAASLEPTGLKKLVRDLHATKDALTYKSEEVLPIEEVQRKKLKFKGD